MADPLIFAGPSWHGQPEALHARWQAALRPPARRGDIDGLLRERRRRPGVIVLADGAFQQVAAVSHAELCRALDAGWQVWGVSSLGAIRAYEMRHEGLRGFGWVYRQIEQRPDFSDDELCLLHFPEPPWWPVTEALINLHYTLTKLAEQGAWPWEDAQLVLDRLGQRWFGDRTPQLMQRELVRAGMAPADARRCLACTAAQRIKTLDLTQLLVQQPWLAR